MFKVTCPSCHKVLKSNAAIPAGKKIKCPGCATAFEVPAQDAAHPPEEAAFTPASDAPRPRSAPALDEPASFTPEAPIRRRKKKKSHLGLIIGLSAGGVALVIGLAVILWLLLRGGGGNFGPLITYLPEKANIVVGIDLAKLRAQPEGKDLVKKWEEVERDMPTDVRDHLDLVVAGFSLTPENLKGRPEPFTVFSFSKPIDKAKMKESLKMDNLASENGRDVHYKKDFKDTVCMAFVSDTMMVICLDEPGEFRKQVFGSGRNALKPELKAECNAVSGNVVWLAADVSRLAPQIPDVPPNPFLPPMVGTVVQTARTIKSANVGLSSYGGAPVNLAISAKCAGAGDAEKLSKGLNEGLEFAKGALQNMPMAKDAPETKGAVDDLSKSLTIRASGNQVTVSVQISEAAAANLKKGFIEKGMNFFSNAEQESAMNMRQILTAIRTYEGFNNKLPDRLDELAKFLGGPANFNKLMLNPLTKEFPGYEYVKPKNKNYGQEVILYQLRRGQRDLSLKVGYGDTSVRPLEK